LPWLIVTPGLAVRAATLVAADPALTLAIAALVLACGVPVLTRLRRRWKAGDQLPAASGS
jgi:hypothetical protein